MDKILESFELKQSWKYLFKEKSWGWKMLVPVIPAVIFGLLGLIIIIPVIFSLGSAVDAKDQGIWGAFLGFGGIALLCLLCVVFVFAIVQSLISYWYQYEYTQIGLEGRESTLIYKSSKMEVIKKAGKLFLVNLIYNIPTSILLGFFYALFIVTGGVRQTPYVSGMMMSSSNFSFVGLFFLCIVLFIALFIVVPYNFYIVQTAKVRLIKTNSFREAFRIRTIIETVKKNFKRLSLFLGVLALYLIVYIVVMIGLSILGIIPFIACCLIPFNIAVYFVVGFFGIFVYPYMLGKVYKEIK